MNKRSLWLIVAATLLWLGACKSAPETTKNAADINAMQQESEDSAQAVQDSAKPEPRVSKVVMWVYKNDDSWSQVVTSGSRDIRGEESYSSRCQGASDVQYVDECLNWSLSVPCETEGEKWFYNAKTPETGAICRSENGQWTLQSPKSFRDSGECKVNVEEAADQEVTTFTLDCGWLSEDRMKKGATTFTFGPIAQ